MFKIHPKDILQELGLKVTRSREAVISVLQNSSNPLTHTELMEKLPKNKSWDRVTVYRILSELEEKKVLRSVSSNERITYFELKDSESDLHGHSHLVCESCGAIKCIEENIPLPHEKKIEQFRIRAIDIIFRGICKFCQ